MSVRIKLKDWDIVVLPFEGRVLGQLRKDGTRKEIFTYKDKKGYHYSGKQGMYPDGSRSRLIWIAVNGPIPDGMEINHINHQRDDDKITNLELVTRQQNTRYTRKRKDNTSGFKGVHYHKYNKKWRSGIKIDNGRKHLGYYDTAEEAARAYDEAARKHFGKFAILNFPDENKEVS